MSVTSTQIAAGIVMSDVAAIRRALRVEDGWSEQRAPSCCTQAALAAAQSLFPAARTTRLANEDLLVPMSDGAWLCVGLLQSGEINGLATKYNGTYAAFVNDGAARALFELSAAVWTNPLFRPDIGPIARLPDPPAADLLIPRGLEYAADVAHLSSMDDAEWLLSRAFSGWLRDGLDALEGARKYAFERTYYEGMRFLFAHERAHVLLGHVDDQGGKRRFNLISELRHDFGADGDSASARAELPADLQRAFELEADRSALDELFLESIKRDKKAASAEVPGVARQLETLLTTLGAAFVLMIFHSQRVYSNSPDEARFHPPLWFRADEVVAAEDHAHLQGTGASAGTAQFELLRFRAKGELSSTLIAIGEMHPLLGEWLAPPGQFERGSSAEAVLKEARRALKLHFGKAPRRRREL
jgi:hypothetical protein